MKTHVIYANLIDTVTLVCEECHRSKTLPAADVKDLPQPLKVRCPCGALFGATIVIRPFYRKKTHVKKPSCRARMPNARPRRTKFLSKAG